MMTTFIERSVSFDDKEYVFFFFTQRQLIAETPHALVRVL